MEPQAEKLSRRLAAALDELLAKVRELDMDSVRAKVAAAETAASA